MDISLIRLTTRFTPDSRVAWKSSDSGLLLDVIEIDYGQDFCSKFVLGGQVFWSAAEVSGTNRGWRTDIDGPPIVEQTGPTFCFSTPRSHACKPDFHMTIALFVKTP